MTKELARYSYSDKMKELLSKGEKTKADALEETFSEQFENDKLNIEIIAFSVRDFHSKKFIGSKQYIQNCYQEWIKSRPPK